MYINSTVLYLGTVYPDRRDDARSVVGMAIHYIPQPFEINKLTGGSGKIRSTFSDCLSALGVLPRTFDCRIYSQTAAAEVAAGGLLRRLCVGGGTCGELRPSPPFALASCPLAQLRRARARVVERSTTRARALRSCAAAPLSVP